MRLIDADKLKQELKKLPIMSNWGEAFIPILIDEQPTVEAVPVVHGKWLPYYEEVEIYNAGGFTERKQTGWICSECGKGRTPIYRNFCSECGSCMRKKAQL